MCFAPVFYGIKVDFVDERGRMINQIRFLVVLEKIFFIYTNEFIISQTFVKFNYSIFVIHQ